MTSVLRFVLIALVLVLTSACGHSPIDPTVVEPPTGGPKPTPTPGTTTLNVPLPDSSTPMVLWAERIVPNEGGQLSDGQKAVVALGCAGPNGYRYFIRNGWVVDGQSDPTPAGGFGSITGPKCDFPIGGWTYEYQPASGTGSVRALRLYVWVDKGIQMNGFPNRPPDVVGDIDLPSSWRNLR